MSQTRKTFTEKFQGSHGAFAQTDVLWACRWGGILQFGLNFIISHAGWEPALSGLTCSDECGVLAWPAGWPNQPMLIIKSSLKQMTAPTAVVLVNFVDVWETFLEGWSRVGRNCHRKQEGKATFSSSQQFIVQIPWCNFFSTTKFETGAPNETISHSVLKASAGGPREGVQAAMIIMRTDTGC